MAEIETIKTRRKKVVVNAAPVRITKRFVNGVEIDEETFFNSVWTNENLSAIFALQTAHAYEK